MRLSYITRWYYIYCFFRVKKTRCVSGFFSPNFARFRSFFFVLVSFFFYFRPAFAPFAFRFYFALFLFCFYFVFICPVTSFPRLQFYREQVKKPCPLYFRRTRFFPPNCFFLFYNFFFVNVIISLIAFSPYFYLFN